MNKEELERYSRNIILPEIGGIGQQRLARARILIISARGLGAPSLMYLTAYGVGCIGIIDFDHVSLSNLQRQILFGSEDIGKLKVNSAKVRLNALNPNTEIFTYSFELTDKNAEQIFKK